MKKHFQYLWYLLRHKWFVFIAGLNLNVPLWRLLVHDWTKFLPCEWLPYVDNFYGDKKDPDAYDRAWNHHQKHNPHHWQYWLLTKDQPKRKWSVTAHQPEVGPYYLATKTNGKWTHVALFDVKHHLDGLSDEAYELSEDICHTLNRSPMALEMPEVFVREMVADWMGAGRAITGEWEAHKWYLKNKSNMHLHPNTRKLVEELLGVPS